MKKILLATSNPGKAHEILEALQPLPEGVLVVSLSDLGLEKMVVEEHGASYGENALIKAEAYFKASGLPTIAEDSGMEVSALAGELGVLTRRWGEVARQALRSETRLAGEAEDSETEILALQDSQSRRAQSPIGVGATANDDQWLAYFMERMKGAADRSAKFCCHAVYLDETGPHHFAGECLGTVTETVEGPIPSGIPLSAVFKPLGESLVYSAMSEAQKNQLSHRGKAIKKLRGWLVIKSGGPRGS